MRIPFFLYEIVNFRTEFCKFLKKHTNMKAVGESVVN
jgi:hypothetical protein